MSRVERTENPSEEPRKAERGRRPASDPNPAHTPTKAEGELHDVEEALKHQRE